MEFSGIFWNILVCFIISKFLDISRPSHLQHDQVDEVDNGDNERHEEEASTGQHHHTAGVLSLLQDLLEVLVVHLNTRRTTGSSDLREEHEGELPLGDPQPARLPVLQLQVEVEVQLEGSGARLGRNSIKSFNHPSLTSPPSSLSPDRIRVPPDRHINSVYCCKTCLVRLTISPSLSK